MKRLFVLSAPAVLALSLLGLAGCSSAENSNPMTGGTGGVGGLGGTGGIGGVGGHGGVGGVGPKCAGPEVCGNGTDDDCDGVSDDEDGCGLVDGPADGVAVEYLEDVTNVGVPDAQWAIDDFGTRRPLSRLRAALAPNASVQEVNDALSMYDASIVSALGGTRWVVLDLPAADSVVELKQKAEAMASLEAIDVVATIPSSSPKGLPESYNAPLLPLDELQIKIIDHHLAVRAPAAWNVQEAIDLPPAVLVSDLFGAAVTSPRFAVNVLQPLDFYAKGPVDSHGFHVLGILAGAHDPPGDASTRAGLVSGIFPGSNDVVLPARFYDFTPFLDDASHQDLILYRLRELRASGHPRIVMNYSWGMCDCEGFEGTERCKDGCGQLHDELQVLAVSWIKTSDAFGLGANMITVAAAGNEKLDAGQTSPLNMAARDPTLQTVANGESQQVRNLDNILVVEAHAQQGITEPIQGSGRWEFSNSGGHVSAIGQAVFSFVNGSASAATDDPGSSVAAPEVAGLAAYIWALDPQLDPLEVISIVRDTAQSGSGPAPLIDAYAAVLAVDRGINEAPIRLTLLDIAGPGGGGSDGKFTFEDLADFVAEFRDATPEQFDYSRFDLNGDGKTGAPLDAGGRSSFDLDMGPATVLTNIRIEQETTQDFYEDSLTDQDILCYYAYSELYDLSSDPDGCERNAALDGVCHCEGPPEACEESSTKGAKSFSSKAAPPVDGMCPAEICDNGEDDDGDGDVDCVDEDCDTATDCAVSECPSTDAEFCVLNLCALTGTMVECVYPQGFWPGPADGSNPTCTQRCRFVSESLACCMHQEVGGACIQQWLVDGEPCSDLANQWDECFREYCGD